MEKLGATAGRLVSRVSQPASGADSRLTTMLLGQLPKIFNRLTDADIPNRVWSTWTPEAGARSIRRPLDASERQALEARAAELAPVLGAYPPMDLDFVTLALSDMFGGFTSMRQSGEEAGARLDSVSRLLDPFPAWAIVKVCRDIQANGVWRDGKFDRQWPPNDSEIVDAIRKEIHHYEKCHRSATALLAAAVEDGMIP